MIAHKIPFIFTYCDSKTLFVYFFNSFNDSSKFMSVVEHALLKFENQVNMLYSLSFVSNEINKTQKLLTSISRQNKLTIIFIDFMFVKRMFFNLNFLNR